MRAPASRRQGPERQEIFNSQRAVYCASIIFHVQLWQGKRGAAVCFAQQKPVQNRAEDQNTDVISCPVAKDVCVSYHRKPVLRKEEQIVDHPAGSGGNPGTDARELHEGADRGRSRPAASEHRESCSDQARVHGRADRGHARSTVMVLIIAIPQERMSERCFEPIKEEIAKFVKLMDGCTEDCFVFLVLPDSGVVAHVAVAIVLDCLYPGATSAAQTSGEKASATHKKTPKQRKNQHIDKFSACWIIAMQYLVSHRNPLHPVAALQGEKRSKRCNN